MKMKKLLSVILAAVMLLGCMSITAFAADDATRTCPKCNGEGTVLVSYECSQCRGRGEVDCGCMFTTRGKCPDCDGAGGDCETCHGTGCCPVCEGRRRLECPICNGEGRIFTGETENCSLCGGNKTIRYVDLLGNITVTVEDSVVSIKIDKLTGILASGDFIDTAGKSSKPSIGSSGNGIITVYTSLTESGTYSLRFTQGDIWLEDASIKLPDDVTELKITFDYNATSGAAGNVKASAAPVESPEDEEDDFITSFTLNKDYNDKYSTTTGAKSTAVKEDVIFTITPVTQNAPTLPGTFTMEVKDGVGTASVDLPTSGFETVGDYWYTITETAGTTAGVTYNDTTYYLHLIVSYKDGTFGVSSAAIRTSSDVTADDGVYPDTGKIDTVTNIYGAGSLTVGQETTVNGEDSSEDTFEATVTFTLPEGTELCGDITYGDNQKVTFNEDGVGTVTIELKGGDTVTFEHIPDGVTYTVEQTGKNEDKGYKLDSVVFDIDGETGDTVSDAMIASGTVSDAADTITITNSKTIPIDVGVILENGAFIVLALGAIAAAAWLIASKRRKSVDAE